MLKAIGRFILAPLRDLSRGKLSGNWVRNFRARAWLEKIKQEAKDGKRTWHNV